MEEIKLDTYSFRTDYKEILQIKRHDGEWEDMLGRLPNYTLELIYAYIELRKKYEEQSDLLDSIADELPCGLDELISED